MRPERVHDRDVTARCPTDEPACRDVVRGHRFVCGDAEFANAGWLVGADRCFREWWRGVYGRVVVPADWSKRPQPRRASRTGGVR
jgi:hypothetical protein